MDEITIVQILFLSLRTGFAAIALNLPLALGGAYFFERVLKRQSPFLEGLINLPLVMPPVITGYLLLLLLGRRGILGSMIYSLTGRSLAFTWTAALIASMFVSFPLIIRNIRTAMTMVDPRMEKAAMTLGAGRFSLYRRVTLPLILPGVVNGMLLGFARSLGEFGATITFAGNIDGETRTLPLAVYSYLQIPGKENEAALLVLISIGISFGSLFVSSRINRRFDYVAKI